MLNFDLFLFSKQTENQQKTRFLNKKTVRVSKGNNVHLAIALMQTAPLQGHKMLLLQSVLLFHGTCFRDDKYEGCLFPGPEYSEALDEQISAETHTSYDILAAPALGK